MTAVDERRAVSVAELTVVVPVRNASAFIDECLAGVVANDVARVIVVDGESTDTTREQAEHFDVTVISDRGRGVAAARLLGVQAAQTEWVALVDVDVALRPGDLDALLDEAVEGGYTALQAGLRSTSGPGYWGRALVAHHRTGRSKDWFGLVATVFRRDAFLQHGLDASFLSGEDIELRWRLERSGARIGVSTRTIVDHRFGDTFDFAIGQFQADGRGLARMATKHGWRASPLLGLPLAAGVRGIALSVARGEPQWIPYYATFTAVNWYAMARQLVDELGSRSRSR